MSFEATLGAARTEGRTLLNEVEAKQALIAAGVPATDTRLAMSAQEAQGQADQMGYPVALKIVSQDIAHKSDVGGVKLGLQDGESVAAAYAEIEANARGAQPNARIDGVSVQQMAKPGTEVIVGMTTDEQFGPVMMFGLGGIMVEVMKDVSFRLIPLTEKDAMQMITDIKGRAVLEGVRGNPPVNLTQLAKLIVQVSEFVASHPEIRELDLNPVLAYEDGAVAVDARIVVAEG